MTSKFYDFGHTVILVIRSLFNVSVSIHLVLCIEYISGFTHTTQRAVTGYELDGNSIPGKGVRIVSLPPRQERTQGSCSHLSKGIRG